MTVSLYLLKLFVWLLVTYGITQVVVESYIFERIRVWVAQHFPGMGIMINCMLCTGIWISFFISILMWSPTTNLYLQDVVSLETANALAQGVQDAPVNTFDRLWRYVIYRGYILMAQSKFLFYDGMVGGTMIWFLSVIEKRLTVLRREEDIYN